MSNSFLVDRNIEHCTGCGSCYEICQQKAISLYLDEGFLYPTINKELCNNCKLCEKVCPSNTSILNNLGKAFVGINDNSNVVYESSSGGAFTSLFLRAIELGYVVYGVKWDDRLNAIVDCAETLNECMLFRKSKYVMAEANNCFSKVAVNLKNDRKVLFSGTPCKCAALINYVKLKHINSDNLLIIDLVCHGAGSQELFHTYLDELECNNSLKVTSYTFRNKKLRNSEYVPKSCCIQFEDGTEQIRSIKEDPFLTGYYSRLFYRPSCYECRFSTRTRVSDITIGDAWGVGKIFPKYDPLKGVSLVIANTNIGLEWVYAISDKMHLREVDMEWAVSANDALRAPTKRNKYSSKFYKKLQNEGFSQAIGDICKDSLKKQIELGLIRLIPRDIKRTIKRIIK